MSNNTNATEAKQSVWRRFAPTRFVLEARDELRKVVWPTRKELRRLTILVVAVTLAFAVFLGLLDILFQFGLQQIL